VIARSIAPRTRWNPCSEEKDSPDGAPALAASGRFAKPDHAAAQTPE
jgi:hypothetical protein